MENPLTHNDKLLKTLVPQPNLQTKQNDVLGHAFWAP